MGLRATVALLLALLVSGCAGQSASADGRLVVVTTTNFVTDTVRHLAGDDAEVVGLMGAGVDPHLYRPTAGDLGRLRQADVVAVGLGLEGHLGEVLQELDAEVVLIGEALPVDQLLVTSGSEGVPDPHIWHDPTRWAQVVPSIADALVAADPEHTTAYQDRSAQFIAGLAAADETLRTTYASLPDERRVLVTSHDAFGYLGDAYGLEVVGLQGISTAAEMTVRQLDEVADVVTERSVPTVFLESSVAPQTVEALVAAADRRDHEVSIGEPLFSDAAGDAGTPEGTYLGMLTANAERIVAGLG